METSLAQTLRRLMEHDRTGVRRLAERSGVPEKTLEKWLGGEVRRPRAWQDVVKVAAALQVSAVEANELLLAAGHLPLAQLREVATGDQEQNLFQLWQTRSATVSAAPFQAIADLPSFVGRERELAEVKTLLCTGQHVAVCSFQGMGGVGKTVFAARVAYELRDHFIDGVLWARVDVSTPFAILETLARSLGEYISQIRDLEQRSSFVRGLLAKKRVLLILDNANASEQVRPLLPATNGASAAIITTRYDLASVDEMHRIEVLPFAVDQGEALALFTHFLGEGYVRRYQRQLVEIADRLGHLPLALTLAAGRIRQNRKDALDAFLLAIRNSEQRLSLLAREDRSVRLSFDLSYQQLPHELQALFDHMGLFGGEDVSVEAVAFVNKLSVGEAARRLEKLHKSSLLQTGRNGRYRLHPLLYSYACEHLSAQTDGRSTDPFVRMLTYFANFVEQHKNDYAALDQELSNLLAAYEIAQQRQQHELLLRQAIALFMYLELRGLYQFAEQQMEVAQSVAHQIGDELAYATALFYSGIIKMRRSEYLPAIEIYQQALTSVQRLGAYTLATRIEKTMSSCYFSFGDYSTAALHARSSLDYARQSGDIVLLAETHIALGVILQHQGDAITGETHIRHAGAFARQANDPRWLVLGLLNLGEMVAIRGELNEAETYLTEALALARHMSYQERISNLLILLGNVLRQRGDFAQASSVITEGLAIARQIGHRWVAAAALIEQGFLLLAQGDLVSASVSFDESHTVATDIQAQHYIGDSLFGMAQIAYAQNYLEEAESLGKQSLSIFESIGYFKAKEVLTWLRKLSDDYSAGRCQPANTQ